MTTEITKGQAAVQIGTFVDPTMVWLLDFRYLTAALLVLILSAFSLQGLVGLGVGVFAFCIFFFFLYRGIKRITLRTDRLFIHSLFIKTLEIQIIARGCCTGKLIALTENCVLIFEAFQPQTPQPTGRACRRRADRVVVLLPRLTSFNHPSYVSLVAWLESRGISVDAPAELENDVEALDLTGSRFFVILLFVFALVLALLAFISPLGFHPL